MIHFLISILGLIGSVVALWYVVLIITYGSMKWFLWLIIPLCLIVFVLSMRSLINAVKTDEAFDLTHPNWWNEEKKTVRQMEKDK